MGIIMLMLVTSHCQTENMQSCHSFGGPDSSVNQI